MHQEKKIINLRYVDTFKINLGHFKASFKPIFMKKVWVQLKSQEKPMLVELDSANLNALDNPNTIIHGMRTNKEGLISRVGFNTDNISSYNYPDDSQDEVDMTDKQ